MNNHKFLIIITCFLLFQTCKEESLMSFSEINITTENNTLVDINIPKASGNESIANAINSEISNIIIQELNIGDTNDSTSLTIEESINSFNREYLAFIDEFPESNQAWEALIDGDVIFQSENIITISLTSYINTGGAHGILQISLLNFDAVSGHRIPNQNLFNNQEAFTNLAKTFFDNTVEDKTLLFDPDNFKLPANMGYSDDGLLLLYNVYEIAPYVTGIIDFTIPYEKIEAYLVFDSSR
ncbi:MAG: DUF3298 and DUF4163 domain-containing protein [Flavobacteriales bacterium]|nr:DUF3298 and DUF4163 domain-containing protein [Flavobacteriia bacterium]NCP05374.1 DUF3298 and DUF4163 domain-containing protein [Flavobacteriales bacterium]PIV92563.1 MAG: DUF3298/DUF4163 domain-containing protein [Flavobacteriaceae bacterium CG17_big_fil_post_rev_8_21_14_2_50_33_15]PIY12665.1 MAG: DUF3298/DUF4163 domain-containing protein [Flavobacteriaceae bacterium CG_4_10_14_3_um_filter_33_47]PJB18075.1 MAG: DUF3298/DUF4163 domain-containing protein [Flavobacteriaceae bacterium CG_4_9_1